MFPTLKFGLLLLPCFALCDDAWIRSLNYFNRINDMMTYDKSNFTAPPNAFVLVTIPKGTKLEHLRDVYGENEDPIWFGFDIEFASTVLGFQTMIHQTFELTQDVDNIMMYDGRATFLNDLMGYMVRNCTRPQCYVNDRYIAKDICAMFPEMNGFIRQYYGYELVLCTRVHEKGHVVLVAESLTNYTDAGSQNTNNVPLFDLTLAAEEERRFYYQLDTLILANETYDKPPSCFDRRSDSPCSFFTREQLPEVNYYRSRFREILRSEPIKEIQEYQHSLQIAIRNLVNRVSLVLRQLKAMPEKVKSILHNTAGIYGSLNVSISEQVQKCVSYHTPSVLVGFDVNFVVQNRFTRENEHPGNARREVIRKIHDSFLHVTEYLCTKTIDMYWNGSKMNLTEEISVMQDRLKWKEFDLCPKECSNKCFKPDLKMPWYYCEQVGFKSVGNYNPMDFNQFLRDQFKYMLH